MKSIKNICLCQQIKFVVCLLAIVLVTSIFPGFTFAGEHKMWTYTRLPGSPEGVCVDSKSNLYASIAFTGEVVLLKDDGSYKHIA